MLTLMRNVASFDRHFRGDRAADGRIAAGLRGAVAAYQPFNSAMQMPDVRGMIDLGTDKGRAMADVMVSLPGADHRLLAGLSEVMLSRCARSAGDHDRLHQGRLAQAVAGAGNIR